MKTAIELIAEERQRQIEKENWTLEHDKAHDNSELLQAAGAYIAAALGKDTESKVARFEMYMPPESDFFINNGDRGDRKIRTKGVWVDGFPFSRDWDKRQKHDKMKLLIISAALIAAEIDRLQNEPTAIKP